MVSSFSEGGLFFCRFNSRTAKVYRRFLRERLFGAERVRGETRDPCWPYLGRRWGPRNGGSIALRRGSTRSPFVGLAKMPVPAVVFQSAFPTNNRKPAKEADHNAAHPCDGARPRCSRCQFFVFKGFSFRSFRCVFIQRHLGRHSGSVSYTQKESSCLVYNAADFFVC